MCIVVGIQGSSYQEGRVGIQLSRGESWDPVIKSGELGSRDPVIKRGELESRDPVI
jgi:hypothetical protein